MTRDIARDIGRADLCFHGDATALLYAASKARLQDFFAEAGHALSLRSGNVLVPKDVRLANRIWHG